jgi:hypothetical protein
VQSKNLFYFIISLIIAGLYSPYSYSQKPTYTCSILNDAQIADNIYEFDIYVLRTGSIPFELALIQFGISYNDSIRNGGELTASYVPGTIDPLLIKSGQYKAIFNTNTPGIIKIAATLAYGRRGSGAIISSQPPGTRIGRLRLTNSVSFAPFHPNIKFNFNIKPYPTRIHAYIGVMNTEITDSNNYITTLKNTILAPETKLEKPKDYSFNLNQTTSGGPIVIISYSLPFESNVNLIVYNSIGEKVRDLIHEIKRGGYHELKFDANSLPGGTYFFTIKATSTIGDHNFNSTKKIVYFK